ncbi:MAG: hypothetical protein IJ775_00555 [Muribaculaceae bacterium]|nr:hypothetical protein [Muribaculaceae bacterium]
MIFSATEHGRFAFMLTETKHMKNRYIKENYRVTFSCVEDFDSLINALDPEKVKAVESNPADADLFK